MTNPWKPQKSIFTPADIAKLKKERLALVAQIRAAELALDVAHTALDVACTALDDFDVSMARHKWNQEKPRETYEG